MIQWENFLFPYSRNSIRTPQQVSDRLDELIKEIKSVIAGKSAEYPGDTRIAHHATAPKDIVCVAHGHILAAFAIRWVDQPLKNGTRLLNEPCGVAVLGFVIFAPHPHPTPRRT